MQLSRLALVSALTLASCLRAGFAPDARDGGPDLIAADLGDAAALDAAVSERWRALGGSGQGAGLGGQVGSISQARLTIGAAGQLYVAWTDVHLGARQVYLRAWRGQGWVDLAGSSSGAGISASTDLSRLGNVGVLPDGHPVVVWFDHGATRRVMLRRFDGVAWTALGSSVGAGGISGNVNAWWPSLALDGAGRVNVVWEQYWGSTGLRLRRFEGGAWSAVGTSLDPGVSRDDGAQTAQLAAYGAQLHVLWRLQKTARLRYRHYDGARWTAIEEPRATAASAASALTSGTLAVAPDGRPWIAGLEESSKDLVVLRRDAAGWSVVTRLSPPADTDKPTLPTLSVSTAGVFVACRLDDRLGRNIYLFRLEGDQLVPLASPVPGGISRSTRATAEPTIAAHDGKLYLSWIQQLGAGWAIYLRYLEL